ncbi:MAG: two-component system, response regulator YesN [Blastocatellia bacterium]|jgi:AraC-like DNA-binding protein|nr:two-component system, response regulator YesN [Blastocatellia bacterium]
MILNERRQVDGSAPVVLRPLDARVRQAMAFIEENYRRDLSLEKVAAVVHLSIWYLCHLFKSETGETPVRYLKAIRMRQAEALLKDSSLSIKEVMNKVGMGDQSHFAKDFKRVYGLTPSQFRATLSGPDSHARAAQEL